jgi:hypothetical protein
MPHEELDSRIYLSTSQVCNFVKKTFGVKYTISGMADLLKRLGFSYKKPDLKPGKADLDKQEYFLKEFEIFIANKAKKRGGFLHGCCASCTQFNASPWLDAQRQENGP